MNQELISIISDFNDTLLSLAQNVSSVCPSSLIATNMKDIEKQIKKRENFNKFIDLFCIKVLQYKEKIDACEESFFMDKNYENDLQDQNESALNHVITLKSVWSELKKENKEIVMFNMQILCELAQQYFNMATKAKK